MKKICIKAKILLIFFGCVSFSSFGQNSNCSWQVSGIHSVQVYREGWALGYPLLELGSNDVLVVSFDELSVSARNIFYSIEHCDSNWKPSGLMEMDYVQGINRVQVTDYQYSFNTTQPYVHYRAELHPETLRIMASGNYLIRFYDGSVSDDPILVRPFLVFENKVSVQARIKQSFVGTPAIAMQELDFVVKNPNFPIANPQQEVKVRIQQNGRTDNVLTGIDPVFLRAGELVYTRARSYLFEAGNEFRLLDVRSTRFWSPQVSTVSFIDPTYHVELNADVWGDRLTYRFQEDFNGRYVVESKEGSVPETDADYVWVHFTLPASQPFKGGEVYVTGGLTNWQLLEGNRMVYQPEAQAYQLSLYLKQGVYGYQYVWLPAGKVVAEVEPLDGSFAQAENDYQILVYFKGFSDRYDRLIGATLVNSLRQKSGFHNEF